MSITDQSFRVFGAREGAAHVPGQRRPIIVLSAVTGLSAAVLAWGWNARDEIYLSPQSGLGYALGIAGTALMVLLLLYSLRKRVGLMRSWGRIHHWFATHMLLGIIGPVAIIFHANFQLGSLNSTVALFCVIVVSLSGMVGRFIYPKIHHGLFGHRTSLPGLKRDLEANREAISESLSASPQLDLELNRFETFALAEGSGALGSARRLLSLAIRARSIRRYSLRRLAAAAPAPISSETADAISAYVEGIRKVAEFNTYARLFSLWHAFHLPFCVMLFLAAAVHVVAVHMY